MSNPITKTAQFNGSPEGFLVAGPERYDGGIWLEEGTTNEIANSSFETNASGWTNNATGNAVARTTDRSTVGSASLRVTGDGSTGSQGAYNNTSSPAALSGEAWALSADVFAQGGETMRFLAAERTGAGASVVDTPGATLSLSQGWHRRHSSILLAGGVTVAQVRFKFVTPNVQAIDIGLDAIQLEKKPYATSYAAGTRAASSASISPAGILSPATGAIAFRATPTIETGVEECWGECGVKGSGTDHMRWGRDGRKHPFAEWSGNDSAYTRVTSSETVNAGAEHFYSIAWDVALGDFWLNLDDHTAVVDAIPDAQENWGAADLKLQATAGGVIYGPFATFERPLTDAEIRRLIHRSVWSLGMLVAIEQPANRFNRGQRRKSRVIYLGH